MIDFICITKFEDGTYHTYKLDEKVKVGGKEVLARTLRKYHVVQTDMGPKTVAGTRKTGDMEGCGLCGGDGYVSEETAEMGGRSHGDTTCPECDGKGRAPFHPLERGPQHNPKPDDWVCSCKSRNRKRWLYCWNCNYPEGAKKDAS